MLEKLIRSLETSPIVKRGEYNYFIHPVTDGVPTVDPGLLNEIGGAMKKILDLSDVDKIVVAEAMGIHIGTVLSTMTGIPMNIVRKREYRLPGEVVVGQSTGYSKGTLYINGINPGDRVVFVDDVVSTGGTTRAIIKGLKHAGADLIDLCFVIRRGNPDVGRPYHYLVAVEVDDRVHVVERCL